MSASSALGWLLRSPPAEWAFFQLRELLINALSQGPIPDHVAFEMDGNRRYARGHKMETVEGHNRGSEALAQILEICYKCGVSHVTVYAFSIENYNRPKFEVDQLMELAKSKLKQLTEHAGELFERYGTRVRFLGQRSLLRPDLLEVIEKAERMTESYDRAVLNICFPYTSREEITQAIQSTVRDFSTTPVPARTAFSQARISQKILSRKADKEDGSLPSISESSPAASGADGADADGDADFDDSVSTATTLYPDSPHRGGGGPGGLANYPNPELITAESLDARMHTRDSPPLDLFVRTSGVERLSDFMLWQCHQDTHIFFLTCLWPEFGLWQFAKVVVEWQWRQKQREQDEKPKKRR